MKTMKINIPSDHPVAEAFSVLEALSSYGAWVEPFGPPGQEPTETIICGRHLIEQQEHEVAPHLIASLERVDIVWLFAPDTGADERTRLAQAWARALLPSTHSLHAPLSAEDEALLEQVRRHKAGGQNHGQ